MAREGQKLLQELVNHFQEKSEPLRRQWAHTMRVKGFLQDLTSEDIENESCLLYDVHVSCLETGKDKAALAYPRSMAKAGVFGKVTMEHLMEGLLTFLDLCQRSLLQRYQADTRRLAKILDTYAPAAHRILALAVPALVVEREKLIEREIGHLRTLVKAGMIVSSQLSLKAVLQRIVNMAVKLLTARYGALGVLDGEGGLSQFITAGVDEKAKAATGPLPVGKGILGVLIKEARPLRLKDLTKDPRAHGFPSHHPPMRSFLGVPIISKGKVLGNLYLAEKQDAEEFSEEDQALITILAAQAAIAIENASLYEELQRSYQELRRSQDLLLRQEKLASLGRLAAGLAHELNNPLNTILGFIEALEGRAQAETLLNLKEFEDFHPFLKIVHGEVDRAASIIRRLLDFARRREPSFESVDLGRLISQTIALVERQALMANQRIVMESLLQAVQVTADAQMLQQAFLNLLTNALDAIEGGGEVRITVKPGASGRSLVTGDVQEPVTSHQSLATPGDFVEISVSDNGCGIPPEDLPKIFDPFFTTKEVGKGTGLGLPICQSIVEQHGGTIEVRSEGVGKGTVVAVRLPRE